MAFTEHDPYAWFNTQDSGPIGRCSECDELHGPYDTCRASEQEEDLLEVVETDEHHEDFCKFVEREVKQLTAYARQKAEELNLMDVGKYNTGGSFESLPLLDAKAFKKGNTSGKVLAVREIKAKKAKKRGAEPFHGIAIDLKMKTGKFTFLTSVDRYDIGAACQQLGSEDTDDWVGMNMKFTLAKGKYVNVAKPASRSKSK
jgi:hypothetical protein